MSSAGKSLSDFSDIPSAKGLSFGIVVSSWNKDITESLFDACKKVLINSGADENKIFRSDVPGSFELPLGAQILYESKNPDAIICLGCVIQGETRHFDFICDAVANGIMKLNLKYKSPFIFGVLTTENLQQAKDRAGGKHGNKGVEAAVTAIQMALLNKD